MKIPDGLLKFQDYNKLAQLKNLKTSPYQRNKHPKEQIERLALIMKTSGVRHPIHISRRSKTICFGQGRKEAALLNGWTEFPVVYQDFASDDEEYMCVQSDNGIAAWSELDLSAINLDLTKMGPFDINLLGIENFVVDMADKNLPLPDEDNDLGPEDDESVDPEKADQIPEKIERRVKEGESYRIGNHQLFNGDCLKVLKTLPDNSVDSLVTDPPAGIAFMGKEWDEDKGGSKEWIKWLSSIMKESLRVMKPGAHGLVWAIPRTSHWTATALEDAGFEVRDVVTHLFGSGFPKSLDISKAIDKSAGAEREVIGTNPSSRPNSKHKNAQQPGGNDQGTPSGIQTFTSPSTPEAKQWEGWGTALKPGSEHWVLVRKPLEKGLSIAENCLKWGCGGINIDKSRIALEAGVDLNAVQRQHSDNQTTKFGDAKPGDEIQMYKPGGRFPSNLLFSHNHDCVEVGVKKVKSGGGEGLAPINYKLSQNKTGQKYFNYASEDGTETVSAWECTEGCPVAELDRQSGVSKTGASRFFYCSKPSKREKNEGCEGLDDKVFAISGGAAAAAARGETEYHSKNGSGYHSITLRKNHHPTVKSTRLMSYLITMITPPDGTLLDCFGGSGTTMIAAHMKGFSSILIEQSPEYCDIILARAEYIIEKSARIDLEGGDRVSLTGAVLAEYIIEKKMLKKCKKEI